MDLATLGFGVDTSRLVAGEQALDRLAQTAGTTATAADRTTAQVNRLAAEVDRIVRPLQNMERSLDQMAQAQAQVAGTANALAGVLDRLDRLMEELVRGQQDATRSSAGLSQAEREVAEAARAAAAAQQEAARQAREEARARDEAARAAREAARIQEQAARDAARAQEQAAREAAKAQAQAARDVAQARQEAAREAAKLQSQAEQAAREAARAQAQAGREAARAEEERLRRLAQLNGQLSALEAKQSEVAASAQRLAAAEKAFADAQGAGLQATPAQVRALEQLRKAHADLASGVANGTRQMARDMREVNNLGIQIFDVVQSLGSGMNPLTILLQQGPEIHRQWSSIPLLFRLIGETITPTRAAIGTLGAAFLAGAVMAEAQDRALAQLSQRLRATRDDYLAMARTATDATESLTARSSLSSGDAGTLTGAIGGARRFSGTGADMERLAKLGQDVATVLGLQIPDAAKLMAQALDAPTEAAKRLQAEGFRGMNADLLQSVANLEALGQRAEATRLVLDAMARTAGGATRDGMTPFQRSMDDAAQAATRMWQAMRPMLEGLGRPLVDLFTGVLDLFGKLNAAMDAMAAKFNSLPPGLQGFLARLHEVMSASPTQLGDMIAGRVNTAAGLPSQNATGVAAGGLARNAATADIRAAIEATARARGEDVAFALRIAQQESGFRQYDPQHPSGLVTSRTGNQGVFQLGAAAASDMGVDRTDTAGNIQGGIAYIAWLRGFLNRLGERTGQGRLGEDNSLVAVGFNAGPRVAQEYITGQRTSLPAETLDYIARTGATGRLQAQAGALSAGMEQTNRILGVGTGAYGGGTDAEKQAQALRELEAAQLRLNQVREAGQVGTLAEERALEVVRQARVAVEALKVPEQQRLEQHRDMVTVLQAEAGAARTLAQAEMTARQQADREGGDADAAALRARTHAQQELNLRLRDTLAAAALATQGDRTLAQAFLDGATSAGAAEAAIRAKATSLEYGARGSREAAAAEASLGQSYRDTAAARADATTAANLPEQERQLEVIQAEIRLITASVAEREREMALLRARQDIQRRNGDVDTEVSQRYLRNVAQQADATESLRRQKSVYDDLARAAESAFDQVGTAVTNALATGELKWQSFGNIAQTVLAAIIQQVLRLAVLNPILNSLLGGSRNTLADLGNVVGGAGGTAATGNGGATGALSSASSLVSNASTARSVWNSISSVGRPGGALDLGSYSMVQGTSLGGWLNTPIGATAVDATGIGSVGAASAGQYAATNAALAEMGATGVGLGPATPAAVQAAGGSATGVSTIGSTLGAGAAGVGIGFMAGSYVGGLIAGNNPNRQTNAQIGAGGGAVSGAIAGAVIGSVVPVIGTAVGALIGGIVGGLGGGAGGGMIGPKPTNAAAGGIIDAGTGAYAPNSSGKATGQTREAANSIALGILETLTVVSQAVGQRPSGVVGFQTGVRDPTRVTINGVEHSAGVNDPAGAVKLFLSRIQEVFTAPLDPDIKTALRNTHAETLDALVGDINFAKGFQQSLRNLQGDLGLVDKASDTARQQVRTMVDELHAFQGKVVELGLNSRQSAAAIADYLRGQIGLRDQVTGSASVVDQALAAVRTRFAELAPLLREFGITAEESAIALQRSLDVVKANFFDEIQAALGALVNDPMPGFNTLRTAQTQRLRDATTLDATPQQMRDLYRLASLEMVRFFAGITQAQRDMLAASLPEDALVRNASAMGQTMADFGVAFATLSQQVSQAAQDARTSANAFRTLATQLRTTAGDLRGGDLSTLDPERKLANARGTFNATLAAARGGDQTAMGNLSGQANALLEASRGYNASGAGYVQDFTAVQAALEEIAGTSEQQARRAEYNAGLMDAQGRILSAINAEMSKPDPNSGKLDELNRAQQVVAGLLGNANAYLTTGNAASDILAGLQADGIGLQADVLGAIQGGTTQQVSILQAVRDGIDRNAGLLATYLGLQAENLRIQEEQEAARRAAADIAAREAAERAAREAAARESWDNLGGRLEAIMDMARTGRGNNGQGRDWAWEVFGSSGGRLNNAAAQQYQGTAGNIGMVANIGNTLAGQLNAVADRFGLDLQSTVRVGYDTTGIFNSLGGGYATWSAAIEAEVLKVLKESTGGNATVRDIINASGSYSDLMTHLHGRLETATAFAEGGIMSAAGEVPLRRYSDGGVARSAQVAVYGEGDTPEAFVPLRDGRSIPVTIQGGAPRPADNREVVRELRATVRVLQAGFQRMAEDSGALRGEVADLRRKMDPDRTVKR